MLNEFFGSRLYIIFLANAAAVVQKGVAVVVLCIYREVLAVEQVHKHIHGLGSTSDVAHQAHHDVGTEVKLAILNRSFIIKKLGACEMPLPDSYLPRVQVRSILCLLEHTDEIVEHWEVPIGGSAMQH